MSKVKTHLKISRARSLEDSIKAFTLPTANAPEILFAEWELRNDDGTLHPESAEFVKAVKKMAKHKKTIERILKK